MFSQFSLFDELFKRFIVVIPDEILSVLSLNLIPMSYDEILQLGGEGSGRPKGSRNKNRRNEGKSSEESSRRRQEDSDSEREDEDEMSRSE